MILYSPTNTISALIIDDEPLAHQVIEAYATDLGFLTIAGTCHRATQAYALLSRRRIDLIFLDINMPELTGLDFLRTLEHKPRVIITSAYGEHAVESFELQVSDYLLKPFSFTRFLRAVNKVRSELGAAAGAGNVFETREDHLFVKVDRQYRRIEFTNIHYLESYGNYVKIWTGDHFLLTTRTLSGMMEELPAADFLKIHKSYVVQKALVDYLEGNQLVMRNAQILPVGKLQREAVRDWVKGSSQPK